MPKPLPLFPTTVIGSLPRLQYVKDLLKAGSRTGAWTTPSVSPSACRNSWESISSPTANGRESYVDVVAEIMYGFRWVERDLFKYHQVVTEKMRPLKPGVIAAEAKFLSDNTDRAVKICLPSPYLIGERMWEPAYSRTAYPTREAFCEALVPVLRVAQLMMESSVPVAGDMAVLKELPESVQISLGCVNVRFLEIDTPEKIVERVQTALKYIAPTRITLNPDCGFAPGKHHEIPLEEAYAKLKNEVLAAAQLRAMYATQTVK